MKFPKTLLVLYKGGKGEFVFRVKEIDVWREALRKEFKRQIELQKETMENNSPYNTLKPIQWVEYFQYLLEEWL